MTPREPLILLPGVLTPAAIRFSALRDALGLSVDARPVELALYDRSPPRADYEIADEVAAIDRAADEAGFDRFHLFGYSAGACAALAYAIARPHRVRSLAVDEPPTDFTDEDRDDPSYRALLALSGRDREELLEAFLPLQVRPGTPLPPPADPPPAWMSDRPDGLVALLGAFSRYRVDREQIRALRMPVNLSRGELTHERYVTVLQRLASLLPLAHVQIFAGRHHLTAAHMLEPDRVAADLRQLFVRARATG